MKTHNVRLGRFTPAPFPAAAAVSKTAPLSLDVVLFKDSVVGESAIHSTEGDFQYTFLDRKGNTLTTASFVRHIFKEVFTGAGLAVADQADQETDCKITILTLNDLEFQAYVMVTQKGELRYGKTHYGFIDLPPWDKRDNVVMANKQITDLLESMAVKILKDEEFRRALK